MSRTEITDPIAVIRERNPIDEVVSEYVALRRAGADLLKGLCPFHDEKTPSFTVRPGPGTFHCFGCGEGGSVIDFLIKIEHLGFAEAVGRLAIRSSRDEFPPAFAEAATCAGCGTSALKAYPPEQAPGPDDQYICCHCTEESDRARDDRERAATHKFGRGDLVAVEGCSGGPYTVFAPVDRDAYLHAVGGMYSEPGHGQLYNVVKGRGIFCHAETAVYGESQLRPWFDTAESLDDRLDRELEFLADDESIPARHKVVITEQARRIAGDGSDPGPAEAAAHLVANFRGTCGCCNNDRATAPTLAAELSPRQFIGDLRTECMDRDGNVVGVLKVALTGEHSDEGVAAKLRDLAGQIEKDGLETAFPL